MSKSTAYHFYSWIAFIGIYLLLFAVLTVFLPKVHGAIKAGICGALTAVLSPKITSFTSQSGKQYQFKWLFLKKPISF